MESLLRMIDWSQPSLWVAMGATILSPLFWTLAARAEYKHKFWSGLFGGVTRGCYFQAGCIFGLSLLRDSLFMAAIERQSKFDYLAMAQNMRPYLPSFLTLVGYGLIIFGLTLVLSSTYRLGILGTFSGDYFGIFREGGRVESFPFNYFTHPMYFGSTCCFLGTALLKASPAGVLITGFVYLVYKIVMVVEEPFTTKIYLEKAFREKQMTNKQRTD